MKGFDYEKFACIIAEALVHALDEKELRKSKSCLNHRCQSRQKSDYETLDPTPLAVPLDCKVPESLDAIMARHIQTYMSKMANQDAYDFDDDISDLDFDDSSEVDFVSKHEYVPEIITMPNVDKPNSQIFAKSDRNSETVAGSNDSATGISKDVEPTQEKE